MNIHAIVSFTAAFSNLFLGFYVYGINHREKINRIFSLGLLSLSFWCAAEGMMRLASSETTAFLWTKISFILSSWLPVIFFYFIFNFTGRGKKWKSFYLLPPFFFTLLLISDIFLDTRLFISGIFMGYWRFYDKKASFGYYLYILYIFFYFSIGLWMLYESFKNEKRKEVKRKFLYALLCAPIPILFGGFSEVLMEFIGFPAYPLASLSTLSFFVLFFGAGFHTHLFTPQPEDVSMEESTYELEEKMSFLSFNIQIHDVFLDMVRHGHEGLLVTSKSREEVETTYGLKRTPVIFLSYEEEKHNVAPEDLNKLGFFVGEFLKESKKSIIYFDSIEILLEKNGFNHVLRFLHSLNDLIVVYSSTLLLQVREESLNEIQRNLLLREFTLIRKDSKAPYLSRFIRM